MNSDLMATPPSRKPTEHHGMADRKPVRYHPVSGIEGCSRRLFAEEVHISFAQDNRPIRNLRF